MDHLTKEKRSWNMSQIKSRNTKPEIMLRSKLHQLGYRFRLHRKDLPGKPDVVLPKKKTAILINGCFWHGHKHCKRSNMPKTNQEYWISKIKTNISRDRKNIKKLRQLGWNVILVWECKLRDLDKVARNIAMKIDKAGESKKSLSDQRQLIKIFDALLCAYGERKWWPAKTRFEIIVGAILVQNVAWKNAKIAIKNLKKNHMLNALSLHKARVGKIASLIKSSRFYNQKAVKLKAFVAYLIEKYDGSLSSMFKISLDDLRTELLEIKGIGEETADSILLYAGKKPSFVSDAYTKRFLERYGLIGPKLKYKQIRDYFMGNLPKDVTLYNEYHALIVHHGYAVCKSEPACSICILREKCLYNA